MLRTVLSVLVVLAAMPVHAQAPAASSKSSFEVATIKLTDPNFRGILVQTPGPGTVAFRGFTISDLIGYAFEVDNRQVVNVPKALDSTRHDVVGRSDLIKSPGPADTRNVIRQMLQALLEDRFTLMVHRETRDGAISLLAEGLQKTLFDRPVVDKTGLQGNFDFDLVWRPDASQFRGRGGSMPAANDPDRADIFTALEEQLGLKLNAEQGSATVIVVDAVREPSEN